MEMFDFAVSIKVIQEKKNYRIKTTDRNMFFLRSRYGLTRIFRLE